MATILKFKPFDVFHTIRFKLLISYMAIIVIVIILLNTYPLYIARQLMFSTKESTMISQAQLISTSVAPLPTLTAKNVSLVMDELDISDINKVIVVGPESEILYTESDRYGNNTLDNATMSGVVEAGLRRNDAFYSRFLDEAFYSYASTPIIINGDVAGAICIYEYDEAQGSILLELQSNMKKISISLFVFSALLSIFLSRTMTRRITLVLNAIKSVREGEYSSRVKVKSHDEIAKLSDEFNNLMDKLQTTEEMRRRFVSDASHELKTPLASIRLLSDSILQNDKMDDNTIHEFVQDIGGEAERLARTTEKLLNLTRLDNNIVTERTNVDVSAVAASVIRILKPLAEEYMVTIETDLRPGSYTMATSDDVYQVILNLAENAVKYNVPGGKLMLTVKHDDWLVTILVEDTGIGIPDADIPNIFDRFYRVDKARSREAGGSGLGLSIVKSTVSEHGGTVSAERRENGGMRFRVVFPLNNTRPM